MISLIDHFKFSDHQPQILAISNDISVMTWNILKRCTYHEKPHKFYNNGFGIIESEYDYHIRLKKIANEICSIIAQNKTIKYIALQELPIDSDLIIFHNSLAELLPHFTFITNATQGFLFDHNYAIAQDNTDIFIKIIGKTIDKIQSIKAITNNNEINFINVHLCWFKSYHSRLSMIKTIIKKLSSNKVIILGDFNLNILDIEIEGIEKYSKEDTTLSYVKDGVQSLQTCDGFMIYDR